MLGWLIMKPFVLDEPVNGTYWPELESNPMAIGDYGTGYYNVIVVNTDISITGYRFDYIFSDESGNRSYLTSVSLPRLRTRVLNNGLKWKVLNVHSASKTLTLNLLDLHFRNVEMASRLFNNRFSGVAYVRRGHSAYSDGASLWIYHKYDKENQSKYLFSSRTLRGLKKKADQRGVPWEVLHQEAYNYICEQEELYL